MGSVGILRSACFTASKELGEVTLISDKAKYYMISAG
jgi:hypothetical protein